MTRRFSVVVSDTSPLITLAAAESLDLLLLSGLTIVIPDMVYVEATRDATRLGAQALKDWVAAMDGRGVRIAATDTFFEYQAVQLALPGARTRNRGEAAAAEVTGQLVSRDPELHALLLFEDTDVVRRSFVSGLPERVAPIATGDFLRALERAGRLQSAEVVLERAAQKGRDIERQRREMSDADTLTDFTHQLIQ